MATTAAGEKMNIEKAVKDAIAEFGKEAYKRFRGRLKDKSHFIQCESQLDLETWLIFDDFILELKPLSELFDHDVSFYGADAYLMWDRRILGTDMGFTSFSFNDPVLNSILAVNDMETRRKTSAALPFDIERAIAGDAVEFKNCYENDYTGSISHEWIALSVCKPLPDGTITGEFYIDNHLFNVEVDADEIGEFLRMKYPKAAK